jgi:hypothetical protein
MNDNMYDEFFCAYKYYFNLNLSFKEILKYKST